MKRKLATALTLLPVLFFLTGILPAFAATFGYSAIGGASQFGPPNNAYFGVHVASVESGTVTSMSAYASMNSGTANMQVGIYRVSDGALICNSGSVSITTSVQWYTFAVSCAITATDYYLVMTSDGTATLKTYYDTGVAGDMAYKSSGQTFGVWPSTVTGWTTDQPNKFSIYATYTPAPPTATNSRTVIQSGTVRINTGKLRIAN